MRLKQRLDAAERKAGRGQEPLIVYIRTLLDDENGDVAEEYRRATIIWGSEHCLTVSPEEGETTPAFKQRVQQMADHGPDHQHSSRS